MKCSCALGLTISAVLAFAATCSDAQTTASSPYYATPSWDQKLPASARFIVLSNWGSAAVLDRETGLVWERSPDPSPRTWLVSWGYCKELTTGGRKGWRLPTIHEIQTLVDPAAVQPALPAGHPFLGILASAPSAQHYYHSSTTVADEPDFAIVTTFANGSADSVFPKNRASETNDGIVYTVHAWCVRGQGSVTDPQPR